MPINKEIRFTTAGSANTRSQVFYNNYLANSTPVSAPFFSFDKPQYYTYGGTLDYYGQDPYSIFTNTIIPPIRFVFTASTFSLSGDSYISHEIYRLDFDTYKLFSDNQILNSTDITNKNDISLTTSSISKTREFVNINKLSLGNNNVPMPEKLFGQPLTINDIGTIQNYFSNPILVITASTSAITGFVYDLFLDQYIKQSGKYKTELFLDKSQFFINTKIIFNINLGKNYSDSWNNVLQITATNNSQQRIASGPFSGISVIGNYFTYFKVPDKPKLEYPIMSGSLTTFTPEFRWSNGDNADSFLIQINYNTEDTGFTKTIYNYPVEKNSKNSTTSTSKIIDSTTDFSTDKTIYNFQVPVKSNTNFLYRVGNSKELIDIFNIRRNVITFTDYFSAISQPEPIKTYVVIESDSPNSTGTTGLFTPPSLDYESESGLYSLSGIVSGSTITGATMMLTYPNSNFTTTITDLTGFYSFNGLSNGNYTLSTNYRGYQQDSRIINLTGDTSLGIKLKLLWGNNYDTFGALAGDNFFS